MTVTSIKEHLKRRLTLVEEEVAGACQRSRRAREEVQVVAVTKTVSAEVARALHELGVIDLGESRPQELWRKAAALADSVRWHQIGHLQTNKIDRTLPLVTMIHSVDSLKLLRVLEKETAKQKRSMDVLIEVNASGEAQKHGFHPEELETLLPAVDELRHVRIRGLMTMAAFEEDPENCRPTFAALRELRERYGKHLASPHQLQHLSMGMTNDFPIAIAEGATIIRLGSVLFEGLDEDGS